MALGGKGEVGGGGGGKRGEEEKEWRGLISG